MQKRRVENLLTRPYMGNTYSTYYFTLELNTHVNTRIHFGPPHSEYVTGGVTRGLLQHYTARSASVADSSEASSVSQPTVSCNLEPADCSFSLRS